MYDLTDGGYFATGGTGIGDLWSSVTKTVSVNAAAVVIALVVLLLVIVLMYFGKIPIKKEGLNNHLGFQSSRGDWGNPGDMVIQPNYSVEHLDGKGGPGTVSVQSANVAAAVVAGQPCSAVRLGVDDAYAWKQKTLEQERADSSSKWFKSPAEKYGQPSDSALSAAMAGY